MVERNARALQQRGFALPMHRVDSKMLSDELITHTYSYIPAEMILDCTHVKRRIHHVLYWTPKL